ncbi:hypothetical protein F383_37915 [Gossypium arboreum]|uniref:Uncharacterized protein n=1 Tax=Gossypium arboreum TaxID=29729 RepID=A0A0B0MGK1_GOSAR|nr:hypothetical protein F383_37915 [Gossypium arboreum]
MSLSWQELFYFISHINLVEFLRISMDIPFTINSYK